MAGTWSPNQASQHISLLEMRAVHPALKALAPLLKGTIVAWFVDNRTVVAHLLKEGGTRAWDLCPITKQVIVQLDKWSINIRPAYLKGIANAGADALSRGKQVLEWCLAPTAACRPVQHLGQATLGPVCKSAQQPAQQLLHPGS